MRTLLETTARATDATHLELDAPLAGPPTGKVKVIVQLESDGVPAKRDQAQTCEEWLKQLPTMPEAIPADATLEEFRERIRQLNEAFPCPPGPRTTAEWMKELREGEEV